MLGITRIIKNELLNQKKLPEKWDDYNIGNVYDFNGSELNIDKNYNLRSYTTPVYFSKEKLDQTKSWEFKCKIRLTQSGYSGWSYFIGLNYLTGLQYGPNGLQMYGSPRSGIEPLSKEITFGVSSVTLELIYRHAANDTKIYCDIYCPDTKYKATQSAGYSSLGLSGIDNALRPHIFCNNQAAAKFKAGCEWCYLKDFKFTHDGKILFKRA